MMRVLLLECLKTKSGRNRERTNLFEKRFFTVLFSFSVEKQRNPDEESRFQVGKTTESTYNKDFV